MNPEDSLTANEGSSHEESSQTRKDLERINSAADGRNKEWEDRARVNLEYVPEGTKTNVERDIEPEEGVGKENKDETPAY